MAPVVVSFDVLKVRCILEGRVRPVQILHPAIEIRIIMLSENRLSAQTSSIGRGATHTNASEVCFEVTMILSLDISLRSTTYQKCHSLQGQIEQGS